MQRYSMAALARRALGQHRSWTPLWRKAAPRAHYRVVIIGAGGHGLATAYYLAKEHGISDVAVLEKGPIGLGNTGRNTTIIRSNYLWDESARIYEHSLKLWEGLSAELNFNLMLSQRGVLNLAHTESDVREGVRRVNANRLNGVDAEWLDATAVNRFCPILDIAADKVAIVAAGHSSVLAAMAGVRLPLQSHPLQALVSEPVKPVLDCVVMSNAVHVYVSQSDKGELVIGAGIDAFNSYAQRGSFPIIEGQMAALLELFPSFSRLKMLRSWAGIVDVSPDASPIIGKLPVEGLYLNGGWGTGGFKATPGAGHVFAHTIAHDEPHPLARPFALDRFMSGALIDEHGAAGVAH